MFTFPNEVINVDASRIKFELTIMEDHMVQQISKSIDNFLIQPWSQNHMEFYRMLADKIKTYSSRAQLYLEYHNDKCEILANIKTQPWVSRNPNGYQRVTDLLNNMYMVSIETTPAYRIVLGFSSALTLTIEYYQREHKGEVKFRVYWTLDDGDPAYVCYYNSLHHRTKKLPEYEKIQQILTGLSRSDIILLVNEIVIYYDIDRKMQQTHIGNEYPVTLNTLAEAAYNL